MTEKTDIEYFRSKGLLPFQAKFALSFIESGDNKYWQLASSVGMGKSRLGAALILHELENNPNKRLLVLAPPALLLQWQYEISSFLKTAELPFIPTIVDRKKFLELESNAPENERYVRGQ